MKKSLILVITLFCGINLYGQSLTFENLHHLLKEKNPNYLLNKPFLFASAPQNSPRIRFIKNESTLNEEAVDYDPKSVLYRCKNKAYIYQLIKQIKYPLILKDGNGPSIFYQYGNTHVMIMIDIYKKEDRGMITIVEK